jgi:hypothetical protein
MLDSRGEVTQKISVRYHTEEKKIRLSMQYDTFGNTKRKRIVENCSELSRNCLRDCVKKLMRET